MKLTLDLSPEESIALFRLATEIQKDMIDAATIALRQLLIAGGYLDLTDSRLQENSETIGEA